MTDPLADIKERAEAMIAIHGEKAVIAHDNLALVERLGQAEAALFECWVESGEDTDGARSLKDIGGANIAELAVRGVKALRADYDEDLAAGPGSGQDVDHAS